MCVPEKIRNEVWQNFLIQKAYDRFIHSRPDHLFYDGSPETEHVLRTIAMQNFVRSIYRGSLPVARLKTDLSLRTSPFSELMKAIRGCEVAFRAEVAMIEKMGGKLSDALRISAYARIAREHLQKTLNSIVSGMKPGEKAVALAKWPFVETAATIPSQIFYGCPECSLMSYLFLNNKLAFSAFIPIYFMNEIGKKPF